MSAPTLSFVVPAHNEEQLLARTLAGLHAAAEVVGEPYEIIVVDDASTDRTAHIAEAAGARVVHVAHRQIARARNAGAAAASGRLFVFVDADTHVPPATVHATLAAWRAGAIGGGASVHLDGRLPWHARLFLPAFRFAMRTARLAAGCYVFCTPEVFAAIGGFDGRLFAAEELALSRAVRRHGRFEVLKAPVITSGRKVRTYTFRELLPLAAAVVTRGPAALRSRAALGLWYDGRRHDPEDTPG